MFIIEVGLCLAGIAFCRAMDNASKHRVCVIDERDVSKAA